MRIPEMPRRKRENIRSLQSSLTMPVYGLSNISDLVRLTGTRLKKPRFFQPWFLLCVVSEADVVVAKRETVDDEPWSADDRRQIPSWERLSERSESAHRQRENRRCGDIPLQSVTAPDSRYSTASCQRYIQCSRLKTDH